MNEDVEPAAWELGGVLHRADSTGNATPLFRPRYFLDLLDEVDSDGYYAYCPTCETITPNPDRAEEFHKVSGRGKWYCHVCEGTTTLVCAKSVGYWDNLRGDYADDDVGNEPIERAKQRLPESGAETGDSGVE